MSGSLLIRGGTVVDETGERAGDVLVREQVANGVAVRMAVLWQLVGSGGVI